MIKVIAIDDEYYAREGMKKTVDWEQYGCIFCGEAEDALGGIELAKRIHPDIVITDIRMPGMDGLKMSEEILKYVPESKFVIVTGYDEFEYAKRAFKIDAIDFILKPIDQDEFIKAIKKAVAICRKQKQERDEEIKQLLLQLINKQEGVLEQVKLKLDIHKQEVRQICVSIFAIEDNLVHPSIKEIKEYIYQLNNHLCFVFKREENKILMICFLGKEDKQDFKELELYSSVQSYVMEKWGLKVSIGISRDHQLENLHVAYEESMQALDNRIYGGKGSVNIYQSVEISKEYDEGLLAREQSRIWTSIRARDLQRMEKQLKILYMEMLKHMKVELEVAKGISINMLLTANRILKESNITLQNMPYKKSEVYKEVDRMKTIDELYELTYKMLIKDICALKQADISAKETGLERAVDYITENYNKDISLSDVAKYSFLSECYLSRRIKKILGIGFSEYVTKLRMEAAIGYLQSSNNKVVDVAAEVGYADYRYFSQVFKKYTGYSPREYTKAKL